MVSLLLNMDSFFRACRKKKPVGAGYVCAEKYKMDFFFVVFFFFKYTSRP